MIMRCFNFLADIFILHLLWLLYSLPIITIGASTTALYYAMMKRIRTDEGTIFKNFHSSFLSNLKQATILWVFVVIISFLFVFDFRFCIALHNTVGNFMLFACSLFVLPFIFTIIYLFPMQAKFQNKIIQTVKNAFFMSFLHIPYTLLLIFLFFAILISCLRSPLIMGFFLICGIGFYSYVTSNIYIQVFRKYIPNEAEEDFEKSGRSMEW